MYSEDYDWTYKSIEFADDESVLFRIKYIGDEDSGIIVVASTGAITFKHGDASSEAADTDTKLDADGLGIIDVSADITDYHSLIRKINSSDNWRAWPVGALPDDDPHTTTTGHFTEINGSNDDCTADGGCPVLTDDSDSKYIVAGITNNDEPGVIHRSDANMEHEIHRVIAKSTYASGTSTLKIYECDDVAGTSRELKELTAGATTAEVAYPAETTPATEVHASTKGKRLAVKLLNSAAMGTVRLHVDGRSRQYGPAASKDSMWSNLGG